MENKIINQIKSLALDMIDVAQSGHPGIVLSSAPIIYSLFTYHLNFNPLDKDWLNRDRFIMSCGHGSALLYSMLYCLGYDISLADLKKFRQIDGITPGHPEYNLTPGVEMTTGPLGQGFASAVGIALGERYLNFYLKKANKPQIIDYYTYVLCSDGDLMEGISYESASFAGTQKLNKLIVLYDSNNISLDGEINNAFNENVLDRFKALNWNTILVEDGNSISKINEAIELAKSNNEKPTLIEIKTVIGKDSLKEGTNEIHGKPLDKNDLIQIKNKYNIPQESFYVDQNLIVEYRSIFKERIQKKYSDWSRLTSVSQTNEQEKELMNLILKKNHELINWDNLIFPNQELEMRQYNQLIMDYIANNSLLFIGGSADLASSTKTSLKSSNIMSNLQPDQKNIWFGVREHAMGAITNGLSLSGLNPFCSTFLVFFDYLKPALRMSALMNLNSTYIFSHDSITIGEDGLTHQPIEQISNLRSIPNVNVFRPYDFKELVGCWQTILNNNNTSCLIINKIKTQINTKAIIENVKLGAYIISAEKEKLDAIIMSSGSEVQIALNMQKKLIENNIDVRIVSCPCLEIFDKQEKIYQQKILPAGVKKIVIEFSNDLKHLKYLTNEKYLININRFGISGKKDDVLRKLLLDENSIYNKIRELI